MSCCRGTQNGYGDRLYEQVTPRLLRYLSRRVESAAAEDLADDVFLKTALCIDCRRVLAQNENATPWRHDECPFLALAYRIADQLATDHHRRARRRDLSLDSLEQPAVEPPSTAVAFAAESRAGSFESEVETSTLAAVSVQSAWRRLPQPDREALWLHYAIGYSVREVAARLTLPVETVKKRLQRGSSAVQSGTHRGRLRPGAPY